MSSPPFAATETEVGVEQYLFVAAVPLLCLVYLFSPLASYIGALLCLSLLSRRLSARVRVATSVIAILSGASIWASREVGRLVSDDFAPYYDIYTRNYEWATERIPAYEVGLPLLFKVIRVALPGLSPNGLMFVLTSVTGLILLFCVERFGLREFAREKRAYCVAMVLLFFSFVLTTQLTRQMLSSVLLVNVFFGLKAAAPRRLGLILASVVHVSAIVVYAVVKLLRSRYLVLLLLLVSVVALANLVDLDAVASLVSVYGVPRVGVTLSDSGANRATLALVLVVAAAGLISLLVLKAARARISLQEKRTLALLLGVLVVYLLSLDVTLGPFRLFLVIHAVMAGWFFAYFTRRFPSAYLALGGAALILWRTRSLYFLDPASSFLPWDVYGPFGALPGYFVLSYLSR